MSAFWMKLAKQLRQLENEKKKILILQKYNSAGPSDVGNMYCLKEIVAFYVILHIFWNCKRYRKKLNTKSYGFQSPRGEEFEKNINGECEFWKNTFSRSTSNSADKLDIAYGVERN